MRTSNIFDLLLYVYNLIKLKQNYRFTFFLICCLFLSTCAIILAQTTDKELQFQSSLIDALKEEKIGNPEKAIAILEKLKFEPEVKAISNYYLSRLYQFKGRHEDALFAINECIRADGSNKWYRIYQVNLLEKLGRYDQVAQTYEKLIDLESNNYAFYENASLNFLKVDNIDQALHIMDLAQTKFGILPSIALKKAELFRLKKKNKKAIEILEASIKDYPNHEELYISLLEFYKEENSVDEIKAIEQKLKKINPYSPYFNVNNEDESSQMDLSSLDGLVANPNIGIDQKIKKIIPFLNELAISKNANLFNSLKSISQKLILAYPHEVKSWTLAADVCFHGNQISEAISNYKTAVEIGNVPFGVWDNLLFSLTHNNQWISLFKYANLALDQFPNQSYPYYALATSNLHLQQYDDAMSNVNQVLVMNKNNTNMRREAIILQAQIYEALGDLKNSNIKWTQAMEIIPNDLSIIAYCTSPKTDKELVSKEILQKAFETKQMPDYIKHYKLAQINYNMKDYLKAKENILTSLENTLAHIPEILELAAQIDLNLNQKNQALKYLQEAESLSEQKDYYKKLIQNLER